MLQLELAGQARIEGNRELETRYCDRAAQLDAFAKYIRNRGRLPTAVPRWVQATITARICKEYPGHSQGH